VAIGTLIAMLIRTLEFMYYSSIHILERSLWISSNKLFVMILEVCIIAVVSMFISELEMVSYISWVVYAIQIFVISSLVVLPINALIYRKEVTGIFNVMKNLISRSKIGGES